MITYPLPLSDCSMHCVAKSGNRTCNSDGSGCCNTRTNEPSPATPTYVMATGTPTDMMTTETSTVVTTGTPTETPGTARINMHRNKHACEMDYIAMVLVVKRST